MRERSLGTSIRGGAVFPVGVAQLWIVRRMSVAHNTTNKQREKTMKNTKLIKIGVSVLAATTLICSGDATSQQTMASNDGSHPQANSVDSTAAQAKENADIDALSKALLAYKGDLGNFPTSDQGLNALVHADGAGNWKGPYIQEFGALRGEMITTTI